LATLIPLPGTCSAWTTVRTFLTRLSSRVRGLLICHAHDWVLTVLMK